MFEFCRKVTLYIFVYPFVIIFLTTWAFSDTNISSNNYLDEKKPVEKDQNNVKQENMLMAYVEKKCRRKLHSSNPRTKDSFVYDVDGFGVYEVKESTVEAWVSYNRVVDSKRYTGLSFICDVKVPAGTIIKNGSLESNISSLIRSKIDTPSQ